MTPSALNSNPTLHAQKATCCTETTAVPFWQKCVDTVCRIALGVFAAFYAPLPFFISCAIGLAAGAVYNVVRLLQKQPMLPDGEGKPVCAQGYMDFLSGMRFPQPIGTLATAVFIAAHTRHDPLFYVPFCGLFIGFWTGRQAAGYATDLMGYTFEPLPKKAQEPCCCAV